MNRSSQLIGWVELNPSRLMAKRKFFETNTKYDQFYIDGRFRSW
jgi:hypothetical protein